MDKNIESQNSFVTQKNITFVYYNIQYIYRYIQNLKKIDKSILKQDMFYLKKIDSSSSVMDALVVWTPGQLIHDGVCLGDCPR